MKFTDFINTMKKYLTGRKNESTGDVSSIENVSCQEEVSCVQNPESQQPEDPKWENFRKCVQIGFMDFTTDKNCIGFYLNPENRWVKLTKEVFSPEMEEVYKNRLLEMRSTTKGNVLADKLKCLEQSKEVDEYGKQLELPFIDNAVNTALMDSGPCEGGADVLSNAGRPAYPFRRACGFLIVQSLLNLSDRDTCKLVSESPYIQYFLGYESFSDQNTIHPSNLVHFRGRLDLETMQRLNDILIQNRRYAQELQDSTGTPDAHGSKGETRESDNTGNNDSEPDIQASKEESREPEHTENNVSESDKQDDNSGTLILDATCAPVNIRFPQDFSILNEARLTLEKMINDICQGHDIKKPRTYVLKIQSMFLDLAKSKKKENEDIRQMVKIELNAIKRNLGYIDSFLGSRNISLNVSEITRLQTIRAVYAQQLYMYSNKTHNVKNRIVSISMPFIRPIIRGKVNNRTEFGPKFDLAVDGDGFSWITFFSFEAFNESGHLIDVLNAYKEKTGKYPERVLADQIYRTRGNRKFCKEHGIRLSGPPLGRKPKDADILKEREVTEQQDMVDRIEVERRFSRAKRSFGIGRIVERTPENVGHAVGMSVFLDNAIPVGF